MIFCSSVSMRPRVSVEMQSASLRILQAMHRCTTHLFLSFFEVPWALCMDIPIITQDCIARDLEPGSGINFPHCIVAYSLLCPAQEPSWHDMANQPVSALWGFKQNILFKEVSVERTDLAQLSLAKEGNLGKQTVAAAVWRF